MRITLFSWLFLIPLCSLFMSFCIFVVSGQCLGAQRSCLIELKDNLKFNSISSTELVRWNESFDCCLQKGLGCSDEHVIGHKLTKESIFGLAHSSSLFGFQNLSLANNKFCSCQFDMLTNFELLVLIKFRLCGAYFH